MATSSQSVPSASVSVSALLQTPGIQLQVTDTFQDPSNYMPLRYRISWDDIWQWESFGVEFRDWWANLAQDELDVIDATFDHYKMGKRQAWESLPQPIRLDTKAEVVTALRELYIEPHNLVVEALAKRNPGADQMNTGAVIQKQENKTQEFFKKVFNPTSESKSQSNPPLAVAPVNQSGASTQSTSAAPNAPSRHSTIEDRISLTTPMLGDPDFVFQYRGFARGVLLVKASPLINPDTVDNWFADNTEEETMAAAQQLYAYLRMNGHEIGVLATLSGFLFMHRWSALHCRVTSMIPADFGGNAAQPTILQLLYYISSGAAVHRACPEKDEYNTPFPIPIWDAQRPSKHIPIKISKSPYFVLTDSSEILHITLQPWDGHTMKSPKTILASLTFTRQKQRSPHTTKIVAAKLWDSYTTSEGCYANEVRAYMRLQSLWKQCVPQFIGCRAADFCRVIYLSELRGKPLNAALLNEKVERNILRAYEEIHKAGVFHNNVHKDHILVNQDHTVAIISYGRSSTHPQEAELRAEMQAVDAMIKQIRTGTAPAAQATGGSMPRGVPISPTAPGVIAPKPPVLGTDPATTGARQK